MLKFQKDSPQTGTDFNEGVIKNVLKNFNCYFLSPIYKLRSLLIILFILTINLINHSIYQFETLYLKLISKFYVSQTSYLLSISLTHLRLELNTQLEKTNT